MYAANIPNINFVLGGIISESDSIKIIYAFTEAHYPVYPISNNTHIRSVVLVISISNET